jgi:type IV pilus assembly protein PilB
MAGNARRDEEKATQRRAQILGLAYHDTSTSDKPLYKDLLSINELRSLKVIPVFADPHHINFGVTNTTSQQTMQNLRGRFLDQRISFSLISSTGFEDYMRLYDPPKEVIYQDVKISKDTDTTLFAEVTRTLDTVMSDDILAYLVKQTYQLKGSDIHLECQKEAVRVRLRVDGVLHPVAALSYPKYKTLLSSIAVAANISVGEARPQAGHINKTYRMATGEEINVNLRVEAILTGYGLDVVMRLFNFDLNLLKLENLGLNERERGVVDNIINHPTGLVLAVGPTGSGKTTTLYSLISTLNTPERKIITLEDPIEYFLPGIMQIPVHGDESAEGFAEKFRAVLRLDPDIVMVGEIRDGDTARTALQAALTGHLVLSTFHAQSSAAALTRLIDFVGLNPLFASSIQLIMSQRLIRRLDDNSKEAYKPDEATKKQIKAVLDTLPKDVEKPKLDNLKLYKSKPTAENPFGYTGQIAIREQLMMSPGVRDLLSSTSAAITTEIIEKKAVSDGMITMLQDGILKAIKGETTLEEVYRVVS